MENRDSHQYSTQSMSYTVKIAVAVLFGISSFLSGMVVMSFNAGGKFNEFVTWKDEMIKWRATTDTQIYTMNREGTWASKQRIDQENEKMAKYDLRLEKAEENSRKIDTMLYKIEGLAASVNELKQKR